MADLSAAGPLAGLRVVELAGLGPAPMAAMLLADCGADVVRVDRIRPSGLGLRIETKYDVLARSRRSVAVDIRRPEGAEVILRLASRADALLEGFRPGVCERLGIGPVPCLESNPRLVYGRGTGWGQTGPLSGEVGHDINYISLAGVLSCVGTRESGPVPPLNLVGDFGGGGLFLAFGVLCALLHARSTGRGQVVDAAMLDGSVSLMSMIYGLSAAGRWRADRGSNELDGGAPYYTTYRCADERWVAVGAIEARFYRDLVAGLALDPESLPERDDPGNWPQLREIFGRAFASRSSADWLRQFEGTEACVSPVLSIGEAPAHPHLAAREVFVTVAGVRQPAPAPRFDLTPSAMPRAPSHPGQHTRAILDELGYTERDIRRLFEDGVVM